jgi:hypothetical protein
MFHLMFNTCPLYPLGISFLDLYKLVLSTSTNQNIVSLSLLEI